MCESFPRIAGEWRRPLTRLGLVVTAGFVIRRLAALESPPGGAATGRATAVLAP